MTRRKMIMAGFVVALLVSGPLAAARAETLTLNFDYKNTTATTFGAGIALPNVTLAISTSGDTATFTAMLNSVTTGTNGPNIQFIGLDYSGSKTFVSDTVVPGSGDFGTNASFKFNTTAESNPIDTDVGKFNMVVFTDGGTVASPTPHQTVTWSVTMSGPVSVSDFIALDTAVSQSPSNGDKQINPAVPLSGARVDAMVGVTQTFSVDKGWYATATVPEPSRGMAMTGMAAVAAIGLCLGIARKRNLARA